MPVTQTHRSAHSAKIEPLITSADAYPLLEKMACNARSRLLFSFRIFDTRTQLRTEAARTMAEGDDWAALLVSLAASGIDIRLQTSDFDPIGGASLHRQAWASLRHLNDVAGQRPEMEGRIEAMAVRHPASVGPFWRRAFQMRARREIRSIVQKTPGDTAHHYPGLEGILKGDMPHLFPATHHQKVAVIDDDFAMIGGIDVSERRWDTKSHDRPAADTWRDVSLAVYGDRAMEVARATELIWSRCAQDYARDPLTRPDLSYLKQPKPRPIPDANAAEDFSVKLTTSVAARGPFSFGPLTEINDTLQTVLALIGSAEKFIYIETQFLRSAIVARALANAAQANKELELVLVLPFAPERFAFSGRRDTAMRHAEALQSAALSRVQRAFGPRAAILSPAKPKRRDSNDQFVAHGAGIVYVHSKVLIVDSKVALVGSANLNGRSLLWDTEASALWRDPDGVSAFLSLIAERLMGSVTGAVDRSATWQDLATQNRDTVPDLRRGFLLPYDHKRPQRFGRLAFWLPDALF